jgi:hypothetical protein
MYCILKIENHPDALIDDEVLGPYETYEEADQIADVLAASPENLNKPYNHRYYNYEVKEMTL